MLAICAKILDSHSHPSVSLDPERFMVKLTMELLDVIGYDHGHWKTSASFDSEVNDQRDGNYPFIVLTWRFTRNIASIPLQACFSWHKFSNTNFIGQSKGSKN